MVKMLCVTNEVPNDILVFRAYDVNDPRWDKIISILEANIPGFDVRYADGNWINFYIPGSGDNINWNEVYGYDEEGIIDATNVGFFNPDRASNGIHNDEVQFDTHDEDELAELWWNFCRENNLITVTKGMADYMTGEMV